MSEPAWLPAEIVVDLNRVVVASTAEPFQLRDEGLLEGALGRVQSNWSYGGEEDIVALAISLIFAVAANHPFAQGNKRTAFEAGLLFLRINGYEWIAPDNDAFAVEMVRVIEGDADLANFARLFEPFVVSGEKLSGPF